MIQVVIQLEGLDTQKALWLTRQNVVWATENGVAVEAASFTTDLGMPEQRVHEVQRVPDAGWDQRSNVKPSVPQMEPPPPPSTASGAATSQPPGGWGASGRAG